METKKVGSWPKGVHRSEDTKRKIGAANTGNMAWNKGLTKLVAPNLHGGVHAGNIPWNKGKHGIYSEETRRKITASNKRRKRSPEALAKFHTTMLGHPTSVETRKKIGAKNGPAMRRNWKNPAYVIMQIQKRGVQPNITETKFGEIFKRYFPDFKYNGDGRLGVVLAGLVPDFVNTNGRKIVIEIFGEYYHGEKNKQLKWHQTELGRVMAYKSVGFNCLILWSKELRNEPELLAKIRSFLSAKAKPPARRSL